MLEVLKGFPDDVLAVSGTGRITGADYRDVLIPEADARIARNGAIRVLFVLGPEFEGVSAGAAWSDAKFGVTHWSKFDRIALVSDVGWITDATLLVAPLFHHPVRTFAYAALDEARAWIQAKDGAGDTERHSAQG